MKVTSENKNKNLDVMNAKLKLDEVRGGGYELSGEFLGRKFRLIKVGRLKHEEKYFVSCFGTNDYPLWNTLLFMLNKTENEVLSQLANNLGNWTEIQAKTLTKADFCG